MKQSIILSLALLMSMTLFAQKEVTNVATKYGIKLSAGVLTTGQESTNLINERTRSTQNIRFQSASPVVSAGFWAQKKFGWLYADGQINYNTYTTQYLLSEGYSDIVSNKEIKEKFQYADLQIMGGLTSHGFRIGVGPVAHILLHQDSELANEQNFNTKQRRISYGFSGSIGYDFNRVSLDIKFDKAFRTIGDHMYYGNRKSNFHETPDVVSLSVAYQLF